MHSVPANHSLPFSCLYTLPWKITSSKGKPLRHQFTNYKRTHCHYPGLLRDPVFPGKKAEWQNKIAGKSRNPWSDLVQKTFRPLMAHCVCVGGGVLVTEA
ncbi:hypothetical protein CDAR_229381 [Caerostris darwini]|uniref:Uncharacterized protein n=1 Tax=Caerostris darwini TaxID=1538125 RepID=A0AAV4TLB7_9ARAC|nr:hypothetical protein CDAR_229381 [Caerostris darwini]